jgi:hypothetical protein
MRVPLTDSQVEEYFVYMFNDLTELDYEHLTPQERDIISYDNFIDLIKFVNERQKEKA